MVKVAVSTFLKDVLKEIVSLLNAESGSLLLFDSDKRELILDGFINFGIFRSLEYRSKIGEGISGKVADIQEPVLVKDIRKDSRFKCNGYNHYNTNSFISIPLFGTEGFIGLINITDKSNREPFTEKDLQFAVSLCKFASVIMLKSEQYNEKYSTVSKPASRVGHEVNNPLDGIIRYTNMLLNQVKSNPEARENLIQIKKVLSRIASTTGSSVDFNRSVNSITSEVRNNSNIYNVINERESFLGIVGKDEKMQKIYNLIEIISSTRATVLIHGESGTGKRMIAQAVHQCNKNNHGKPFVEVSCGALTETLLESELFGHVKGSFTGAIKDKIGRFELADTGTIFLDEIDAFSTALQVKLLRVIQEGEFEKVGDNETVKIDVRLITATNQNLEELIAHGKFRKDLFYRLNIISIEVPPLRQRKDDIPLLAESLIAKLSKSAGKKIIGVSKEALDIIMNYDWPGNVRELENVIERALILSKTSMILPDDFPEFLQTHHHKQALKSSHSKAHDSTDKQSAKLKDALKNPEKDLILNALESVGWNRNKTAKALGINRTTLYKKMISYNLLNKGGHNKGGQTPSA